MIDFAETIEDCRLLDPGYDGAEFTWAKNGLFERLDRMFVSEPWTKVFEASRVTNLPRVSSDHGPILARCKLVGHIMGGSAFRFQNMWVRHKGFKKIVQEAWEQPTGAIEENGQELTDETEIRNLAANFFQGLLAPECLALAVPDLDLLHHLPPSDQLEDLPKTPGSEEIKRAVFDISGNSAPGPDGFTATFFQACWETVGPDVEGAIVQFFLGAFLPRSIRATSIVLIPKKSAPRTWGDYRPISLCNVINKVITKILVKRLTPFLPQVIAPNQSGFVKGRLLNDNVLLAQGAAGHVHV